MKSTRHEAGVYGMAELSPQIPLAQYRVFPASRRNYIGSDVELLRQFVEERDEGAFAILVARHGKEVLDLCQTILGDLLDAEDAVQSVFIKLSQQASQAVQHKSIVAWLCTVARREAWTIQRSKLRRKRLMENAKAAVLPSKNDPPPRIMQAEIAAVLREEIEGLPEGLRVALVHRYIEERTLTEIAYVLGCTDRAVAKRLVRGEEILRWRLTRRGMSEGSVVDLDCHHFNGRLRDDWE